MSHKRGRYLFGFMENKYLNGFGIAVAIDGSRILIGNFEKDLLNGIDCWVIGISLLL